MPQLDYHVELTAERLEEIQAEEGAAFIPLCENEHSTIVYAEYLTEVGGLVCAGCSFCRECERELLYIECGYADCKLYLKPARAKDA